MHKDIPPEPEYNSDDLNPNEKIVLEHVSKHSKVSESELANKLNVSRHKILKILNLLEDNKFIERIGSDKDGHWHLIQKGKKRN